MKNTQKTNASRILDSAGIDYALIPYEVDEDDLSAVHVAEMLHEDLSKLFKTLVLIGNKTGYFVCMIAADSELDLKKAAKISGNKKSDLIPMKDLLPLTGYVRGGCTPIGMKKDYPVYIDGGILMADEVYISAGRRGLQIRISPTDLIRQTQAVVADLVISDEN